MSDKITVMGNIAEPTMHTTQKGDRLVKFRIASDNRWRDQSTGEWTSGESNWYTVLIFDGNGSNALGTNALGSLRRGERVIVTGRLRLRKWQNGDRQGLEPEIVADGVGHDLRWGMSAFTAKGPANEAGSDEAWSPSSSPADEAMPVAGDGTAPISSVADEETVLDEEPVPF